MGLTARTEWGSLPMARTRPHAKVVPRRIDERPGTEQTDRKGRKEMIGLVAKGLTAVVFAVSVVATHDVKPAQASMTESSMACGLGTETVAFGFPQEGAGRMSVFAYRINGGAWQYTSWYYTWNGFAWIWDGARWVDTVGGVASFALAGNNNLVEGWEYRYDPATGSARWLDLGSCRTSSFFDGGIRVYNR